jgi:hypothetical protein
MPDTSAASQLSLDSVIQILLRVEKDVARVDTKVSGLDQKVDVKVTDLDIKVNGLIEQKGKISGGISIVRWVSGALFTVIFGLGLSGGSYFLGAISSHLERIVTLEVSEKNLSDRMKENHADDISKLSTIETNASGVPQLREEVAALTKAVSDRTSDVEKMRTEVSSLREDLDKLSHKWSNIDDEITVLKDRLTPSKR